jgi:hypothetical protein
MDEKSERRTDHRSRTLKGARIVYNRGYGTVECTVRNLSDKGALVETAEVIGLPRDLVLYINPDHTGRPCRVIWHEGKRMGVEFTATEAEFAARPASQSLLKGD